MTRFTPPQLRAEANFAEIRGDGILTAQMLRQAAEDAEDAERWRWLVAENNKGGSRAKFLVCWWSKDGDGYETTNGTSVDGHDPKAIVRLIDTGRRTQEKKV